ncbi:helix-turn-helix domain-containing protein, partial [Desulfovirgula thermocuniculi]|uniref:helix-turn-helix domain-containing protein n=1 Tax=Desulfovirgula thermocuniculi TaxID=348842 RepID=UPI001FDF8BA0
MSREWVTLSQKELSRIQILEQSLSGLITTSYAAFILNLSERQVYRLKAKLREHGPAALAHGNRGRKPAHAIPDEVRQLVVQLAQTKYRGCNYSFLSELLYEHEGI